MAVQVIAHPGIDERRAAGRQTRERTPPSSHAGWRPAAGRPDPVALLEAQNLTREPDLVPVRHGRMMVSPFTFYRGAAAIMAADLKDTPVAGLDAQLCGDAHLSNFGLFASPERRLLFDLNDFDETLPGPFEYDVKRMAASFLIAARNNGFSKADARAATQASVAAYREAMAGFAQMPTMDIWYAHLDEDELRGAIRSTVAQTKKQAKEATKGKKGEQAEAGQDGGEAGGEECREGAHAGQPAGTVQARRTGRRDLPHRQPAAGHRPGPRPGRGLRPVPGRGHAADPRPVPRLPGYVATRPAPPAGAVRDRGRGPQGGGGRQRGDPRVHRPAAGTRRPGPAVPADQGGDRLGAGGLPAQEPLPAARGTGGARAADDAGRQRHLPGLDQGDRT